MDALALKKKEICPIEESRSKYYMVMDVEDKPGVLASIAKVFGDYNVSINSMIQKQTDADGRAMLIFITHEAANRDLFSSVEKIKKLDMVNNIRSIIRVEDFD